MMSPFLPSPDSNSITLYLCLWYARKAAVLLTKFYKLERLFAQVFRAFESARGVDELFEIAELIVNPAQYLSQDDQDRR